MVAQTSILGKMTRAMTTLSTPPTASQVVISPGEAFTFPFRDPDWPIKFLLGGCVVLLSLALVGIPVLYGYLIQLTRNVRDGRPHPLPEWRDLGVMFLTGLKYLVVLFIYALPIFIVMIPLVIFIVFNVLIAGGGENFNLLDEFPGIIALAALVGLYSLATTFIRPVLSVRFADNERIGDALSPVVVLRDVAGTWQQCIVIVVLTIAIGFLAAAGLLLLIIGVVLTAFYARLVEFHLYGQLAVFLTPPQRTGQP